MLSVENYVVQQLKNCLTCKVYLENYTQKMDIPCVTYIESGNRSHLEGDDIRYSNISYTLKVWSKDIADINTKSQTIDKKMKSIGFVRDGSNTLINDGLICKILNYSALGREKEV